MRSNLRRSFPIADKSKCPSLMRDIQQKHPVEHRIRTKTHLGFLANNSRTACSSTSSVPDTSVSGEDVIEKSVRKCAYNYFEYHLPRNAVRLGQIRYYLENKTSPFSFHFYLSYWHCCGIRGSDPALILEKMGRGRIFRIHIPYHSRHHSSKCLRDRQCRPKH